MRIYKNKRVSPRGVIRLMQGPTHMIELLCLVRRLKGRKPCQIFLKNICRIIFGSWFSETSWSFCGEALTSDSFDHFTNPEIILASSRYKSQILHHQHKFCFYIPSAKPMHPAKHPQAPASSRPAHRAFCRSYW